MYIQMCVRVQKITHNTHVVKQKLIKLQIKVVKIIKFVIPF